MDFQDNILDILVEKNAIDQSDSEEVMAFPRRKERVRCLLLKLAHYDETTFKQFIEALQQEKRGDLARSLTQKYEEYKDTRTNNSSKCNHCKIKLRVDIKDIIDTLYHERVIDEAFVDKVNRSTPSARSMLWNECFFRLKRSNKHDILSQCLHAKYRRYVTEPTGHYFKCTCFTTLLSGVQDSDDTSSASGSLADRSASTSASSSPFSTFSSSSSTMRRQLDINVSSSSRGFKMSKYLYKKSGLNSRRHVRTLFDENIPEENNLATSEHTGLHRPTSTTQTSAVSSTESEPKSEENIHTISEHEGYNRPASTPRTSKLPSKPKPVIIFNTKL